MRRCPAWRQLHPDIASALLWVWADRLTASLTSANVDPKKLAEIINRTEPADLTTVLVEPDEPSLFRDFAIRGEPEGVAGALIAGALPHIAITKLAHDLRARVLSSIGFEAKDVWFPKLEIGFPRRAVPGAWVATDSDSIETRISAPWPPTAGNCSGAKIRSMSLSERPLTSAIAPPVR